MTPACRDCALTSFTPRSVGRYDVTLTVTDGDGRTDSDTLYVYVEEAGPTVALTGDTDPRVDDPTSYDASARARDADLERLTWKLGNRTVARTSLSGSTDSVQREFGFTERETYRLIVVVRDASNRTARDVLTIEPRDSSGGAGSGSTDVSAAEADGGTGGGCGQAAVFRNPTGSGPAAAVTCADGNSAVVDRHANEICSSDIRDCEYAESDGMGSYYANGGGDENGGRTDEISFDYRGGNVRESDNPPNGGRGYSGVI
jgi:hypothetical protein